MRPQSIVLFERIYWLNIALALVTMGWVYSRLGVGGMIPNLPADAPSIVRPLIYAVMIAVGAVTIGIKLALWFFTARRGSNVARWIFVVFFVLALAGIVRMIGLYDRGAMSTIGTGLWGADLVTRVACVWLLFRRDANAWFQRRILPHDLHDTFS